MTKTNSIRGAGGVSIHESELGIQGHGCEYVSVRGGGRERLAVNVFEGALRPDVFAACDLRIQVLNSGRVDSPRTW